MTLGEELRRLRGNTPQRSIADRLGVSPALLSNYENDYAAPSSARLRDMVELYCDEQEVEDMYESLLQMRQDALSEDKVPSRISKNIMRSIHEVLIEILTELRRARAEREQQHEQG